MAGYGWEIYDAQGNVATNDSSLNCFYLDHYISPGNGYYKKSFPDYAYSDIHVMCGGAVVPAFAAAPPVSSTVTYDGAGVPTVTISDSGSNGGTYWITSSRIDPQSALGSGYGINLYDAVDGVAFPSGSAPFEFIGKGSYRFALNSGSGFRGEPAVGGGIGCAYIETYSSVPPLCFWRSSEMDGETMHALPAFGCSVKKSEIAPTQKTYRWALGVTLEDGNSEYTVGSAPYLVMPYCFQPAIAGNTGNYGIATYTGSESSGIALTARPLLRIERHIVSRNSMNVVGNDLRIYVGGNPGMLPLYSFRKYVPPGNLASKFYVVYWYPSRYSGYIQGTHLMGITRKGYATYFDAADIKPTWYLDSVFNKLMGTHVVDLNRYK